MKGKFKKILTLPIMVMAFIMFVGGVNADTVPDRIKIDWDKTNNFDYVAAGTHDSAGISLEYITVKSGMTAKTMKVPVQYAMEIDNNGNKVGDSFFAFCYNRDKDPFTNRYTASQPAGGFILNKNELDENDAGLAYILLNGPKTYSSTSGVANYDSKNYYITQIAIWWYSGEVAADFTEHFSTYYNDPEGIYDKIKTLVTTAKQQKNDYDNHAEKPNLTATKTDFKYNSSTGKYEATVTASTNVGKFTKYAKNSTESIGTLQEPVVTGLNTKNLTIKFAFSSIKTAKAASFKVKVTANNEISNTFSEVYYYDYSGSGNFQRVLIPFVETQSDAVSASKILTLNITPYSLKIKKVDEKGNAIAGAHLQLLSQQGSNYEGPWTSTTDWYTIAPIDPGTYHLIEISAPSGYVKNAAIDIVVNSTQTEQTYQAENKPIKLQIKKIDEKGQLLKGAHFELYNSKNIKVDEWDSSDKEAHIISPIAKGKYKLVETKAPDGYAAVKKEQEIEVQETADIQTITVSNSQIQVSISKVDITNGKEIAGAELVLKDNTNKVVEQWISEKDKSHVVNGLNPGKYTLEETIAPEGYLKTTEKVEFIVNEDGTVDEPVIMKNEPIKVEFSKKDEDTQELIGGAKLVLRDEKGEIVEQWTTKEGKTHIVSYLVKGKKYTLEEVEAPEGYEKAEKIEFIVAGTEEPQQVNMNDKELVVPVPDTSSNQSIELYVVGALMLVVGFTGIVYYRKRYNK